MSKKYDWIIISGEGHPNVTHANIIKNKTKTELGKYIKSYIPALYDHFENMLRCNESGGKIWKMMHKLMHKYKEDKNYEYVDQFVEENVTTEEQLYHFVDRLKEKLDKITNENIVNEFNSYGEGSEGWYVVIEKLRRTTYDIVTGEFSENED